jgi:D-arabinose 1-dehydrogenase-like Zn-dependent alcohol dehydrogenase
MDEVDKALERLERGDVRYRFVIDASSFGVSV